MKLSKIISRKSNSFAAQVILHWVHFFQVAKHVLLFVACLLIASHALSVNAANATAPAAPSITVMGDTQQARQYPLPESGLIQDLVQQNPQLQSSHKALSYQLIRLNENLPATDQTEMMPNDVLLIRQVDKPVSLLPVEVLSSEELSSEALIEAALLPETESELEPNLSSVDEMDSIAPMTVEESFVVEPSTGAELFANDNAETDYRLQAGDILAVDLAGEEGFEDGFLVSRDGLIYLPEVGELSVGGLTIEAAQQKVRKALSAAFLGLDGLLVTLQESRLLIQVLGYVENPGDIELSGNGNMQMAINAAGGFREGAQLNQIQLRRDGKGTTIDFRKYLNTGDDSYIPTLKSLDTIFVPSSPEMGNVYGASKEDASIDPTQDKDAIKVIGEVIKPGGLAFKPDMTAVDALLLAGGVTRYADDTKIRVINNGVPEPFSLADFMLYGAQAELKYLSKGATIYVPIKDETAVLADDPTDNPDSIKIFGEVAKPGVHKYKENISLVDIILLSGGTTQYANVEQIRLISKGEPVLFNLKSYLDSGSALPIIGPGATIFVPKQVEAISTGDTSVYIMGQVNKPGAYEAGDDVKFIDVLANAGGPNRFADTSAIRIVKKTGEVIKFNFDDYSEGRIREVPEIGKGDSILLPEKTSESDKGWLKYNSDQTVRIVGAVEKPGRYPWSANIDFMDLFSYAGGGTQNSDLANIRLIYLDGTVTKFNFQKYIDSNSGTRQQPELVGGVTIVVPELPQSPTDNKSKWVLLAKEQAIYIFGAVSQPGRYAFNDDLGLLDLLTAANGPSPDADLSNIRVVHRNEGSERLSSVNLIEYFATGDEALIPDIKSGDSVYVASRDASLMGKDQTITVLGEVKQTGRLIYRKNMTVIDLISEAGGTSQEANLSEVVIRRGNETIEFDLEEHLENPVEVPMVTLLAGDVVFVSNQNRALINVVFAWLKDIVSLVPLFVIVFGL